MVTGWIRDFRDYVPGFVLNLALIVTIVGFRWSLLEVAVMYVLEIAIINLLYLGVALFTPQAVDDLDDDRWSTDPTPIQPISLLPPIYWRNIRFIASYVVFTGVLVPIVLQRLVSRYGLDSVLTPSVGLAVIGITLFELTRVWRYFIADRSYLDKSPVDAVKFGLVPLSELFLLLFYVVIPVTVVLVGIGVAADISFNSRIVLLLYLVPMGAIRVWIAGLDPQTDDIEISVS